MKAVSWKMSQGEDGLPVIAIEGSIVETSNLQGLLAEVPQKATLDLYGVDYINSAGTREWINFLTLVSEAGKEVSFVRCSVAFVRLFNIVANVAEKYHIASIMAPYVCPDCDHEDVKVIELGPEMSSAIDQPPTCSSCSAEMEFDEIPDQYLRFARNLSFVNK